MLLVTMFANRNKCHASSNRCRTSSNKKLLVTSASLLVSSDLWVGANKEQSLRSSAQRPRQCAGLLVEQSYSPSKIKIKCIGTKSTKKLLEVQ